LTCPESPVFLFSTRDERDISSPFYPVQKVHFSTILLVFLLVFRRCFLRCSDRQIRPGMTCP
jgi:hypothetical protein